MAQKFSPRILAWGAFILCGSAGAGIVWSLCRTSPVQNAPAATSPPPAFVRQPEVSKMLRQQLIEFPRAVMARVELLEHADPEAWADEAARIIEHEANPKLAATRADLVGFCDWIVNQAGESALDKARASLVSRLLDGPELVATDAREIATEGKNKGDNNLIAAALEVAGIREFWNVVQRGRDENNRLHRRGSFAKAGVTKSREKQYGSAFAYFGHAAKAAESAGDMPAARRLYRLCCYCGRNDGDIHDDVMMAGLKALQDTKDSAPQPDPEYWLARASMAALRMENAPVASWDAAEDEDFASLTSKAAELLGPNSPVVLELWRTRSRLLAESGDKKTAEGVLRKSLEIHASSMELAHPYVVRQASHLADILEGQKNWMEVLSLLIPIADAAESKHGPKDLRTLALRSRCLNAEFQMKPSAEVRLSLSVVLAAQTQQLRERHRDVLQTLCRLARADLTLLNHEAARESYQRATDASRGFYPDTDPDRFAALLGLASVWPALKKVQPSPELAAATAAADKLNGNVHPMTLRLRYLLIRSLFTERKFAEVIEETPKYATEFSTFPRSSMTERQAVLRYAADACIELGSHEAAVGMLEVLESELTDLRGVTHPFTVGVQVRRLEAELACGRTKKVVDEASILLPVAKDQLKGNQAFYVLLRSVLGQAYLKNGQPVEAQQELTASAFLLPSSTPFWRRRKEGALEALLGLCQKQGDDKSAQRAQAAIDALPALKEDEQ